MICKSVSHKGTVNYKKFIHYLLNKDKKSSPADDWVIVQNAECLGSDAEGLTQAFQHCETLKPKRAIPVVNAFHEIISASPDAPVNADIMYDLALKYLELRNTKGGIALASYHTDKEHKHIHILLSGGNAEGKSTRLSKKEFYTIREEFERYQRETYPQILDIVYLPEFKKDKSLVQKQKSMDSSFVSDAEFQLARRGHNTDKQMLQEWLCTCCESASNFSHLYSLLEQKEGLEVYSYRGKVNGLKWEKRKYRFRRLVSTPELQNQWSILERLEELEQSKSSQERDHSLER